MANPFKLFPLDGDLYWTIWSAGVLVSFAIGETLGLLGWHGFIPLTWYIRSGIPRLVLIIIAVIFAAFIVWHFALSTGWGTRPLAGKGGA
ncbi:MAG TPA: hypothetical protein VFB79_21625 [Candidatus Angelobacter sp.]|nr:hypothetical protein [Candidatus Angelobacter sp.]